MSSCQKSYLLYCKNNIYCIITYLLWKVNKNSLRNKLWAIIRSFAYYLFQVDADEAALAEQPLHKTFELRFTCITVTYKEQCLFHPPALDVGDANSHKFQQQLFDRLIPVCECAHIECLNAEILREFVSRVIVHSPEDIDGIGKQRIQIIYNGIGEIILPGQKHYMVTRRPHKGLTKSLPPFQSFNE